MERDFISIFIFALGTAGSIYIFKSIFDFVIKRNFSKLYGIGKLPRSIKIRKKSNEKGENYYYLNYPYWSVSKKDGTADRRVKKNYIIWKRSKLYMLKTIWFLQKDHMS